MKFLILSLIIGISLAQSYKGFLIPVYNIKGVAFIDKNKFSDGFVFSRKNQYFISENFVVRQFELPYNILDIAESAIDKVVYLAGYGGVYAHFLKNDSIVKLNITEPIWEIFTNISEVICIGNKNIYIYNPDSGRIIKKIHLPKPIISAELVGNTLWINIENVGLHIINKNGAPVALPYAHKFQKLPFHKIVGINKKLILFGADNNIYKLNKNNVEKLNNKAAEFIRKHRIKKVFKDFFFKYIVVLTEDNIILYLNPETLQIEMKFEFNFPIKNITRYAEDYELLLVTKDGINIFIPDEEVINYNFPELEPLLNAKLLQEKLYLFGKNKTIVINLTQNTYNPLSYKNLIFTDVNSYNGKLIFSSNEGLWEKNEKNWKNILPNIPVLKFLIFSDTFALKLLDRWIFVKKQEDKWQRINLTSHLETYYLSQQKYMDSPLPVVYDFAFKHNDGLIIIQGSKITIMKKNYFTLLPIGIKYDDTGTHVLDLYFPPGTRGKLVKINGEITIKNLITGEISPPTHFNIELTNNTKEKTSQKSEPNYFYLILTYILGIAIMSIILLPLRKRK